MPILSLVVGRLDFSNWFVALDGKHYDTLAQAQASGTAAVNFGMFLSGVLNFIIMAFVVFLIVKVMNRLFHGKEEPAAPTEKTCPFARVKFHWKQHAVHIVQACLKSKSKIKSRI